MGLLSSTNGRKVFINKLLKYGPKISVVSYVIGLLWMILLAHHEINAKNYFSENQLLPGLVHTYFTTEHYSYRVYNKFQKECSTDSSLVKNHVISEMNDIGLDVFTQDFHVKSLGLNGTNIFGIYRAPRAPGVESIILNVPFRKCKSHGSLALLLGASKYFQSQTYWAKDIIFLVTDHELYGMKAWLEAYFDDKSSEIETSDLMGHSGSIQTAVVLDFEQDYISYFDLLIEGLNGQLPNLDLINLVIRIANIEDIPIKFQHQRYLQQGPQDFSGNLETFVQMMISQACGRPTGNHGLFYKYRIEAISLHGINDPNMRFTRRVDFEAVGRMLDGIFRSVNNMLEHFHQSFFLYVLPNTHRYISIGLYMPPLGCMIAPYIIWLTMLWIDIFKMAYCDDGDDKHKVVTLSKLWDSSTFSLFFMAIIYGFFNQLFLPILLKQVLFEDVTGFQLVTGLTVLSFAAVLSCRFLRNSTDELSPLIGKFYMLLTTATLIVVLSILNFPTAFFICLFYTPLTIITCCTNGRLVTLLRLLLSITCSPVIMCWIVCVIRHVSLQTENNVDDVFHNSLETFKQVLTSSLHDSILGVWTRTVMSTTLFPIWIVFTTMLVP